MLLEISDPRWSALDGWVKMQSVIENADGTKTTIHYVYNEITGAFDDFDLSSRSLQIKSQAEISEL